MAVGLPLKTTYANGDVYSAGDVNDTNGTINANVNPFVAGKNRIINGNFSVNQRAFSSSVNPAAGTYTFDRWAVASGGGTVTYSLQAFTPGTAPVTGYEGTNFARTVTSGQSGAGDYAAYYQRIEDVRTFANSTVTISFWAKAATGTPKVGTGFDQRFGTGGSGTVTTSAGDVTISTSWARYSVTKLVPSVSGKTIGPNSDISLFLFSSAGSSLSAYTAIGVQNATIDIWGVQVEQGSTATAFQTATGTIQGELAACQRYYWRAGGAAYQHYGFGVGATGTISAILINNPTSMRAAPTSVDYSTLALLDGTALIGSAVPTIVAVYSGPNLTTIDATVASGVTVNRPYRLISNNSTSGFIGFSAEL
jgi:hypothetical protein